MDHALLSVEGNGVQLQAELLADVARLVYQRLAELFREQKRERWKYTPRHRAGRW